MKMELRNIDFFPRDSWSSQPKYQLHVSRCRQAKLQTTSVRKHAVIRGRYICVYLCATKTFNIAKDTVNDYELSRRKKL